MKYLYLIFSIFLALSVKATITVTNFTGRLTRLNFGDIKSGLAKYPNTFGNDPFTNPSNLQWMEQPTQIDPTGSVITDLIMASKPRLESGITYVYAIGHTGRLYKIQVNDPTTYNPDYDHPVLLATLAINSPTFKYGSSINFFDATAKIYIGHDLGFTSINFNGTAEAFIGSAGSYTANVPRPAVQFGQYLYGGNGTNLVQIINGGTVGSYGILSSPNPTGTVIRDLDVNPDGTYIQMTVSAIASPDLTTITQDTNSLSSADSYLMLWNGVVDGTNSGTVTSYSKFNAYSLNANTSFGNFSYQMGYDLGGAAMYDNGKKIISLPNSVSPNFEAMFSTGNLVGLVAPEEDSSVLKASLLFFGQYDREVPVGLYRLFRMSATTQTDIQQVPMCVIVSNLFYGASSAGYAQNKIGSAKIYFSTLETDSGPTTKYKLYKFTTVPTGAGTAIQGVYETQSELFTKKIKVSAIRLYTTPLVANNSFKLDLIGSSGGVIPNSTITFTAGTNPVSIGQDFLWYTPVIEKTYCLGVRITNLGTANWTLAKLELDIDEGGQ